MRPDNAGNRRGEEEIGRQGATIQNPNAQYPVPTTSHQPPTTRIQRTTLTGEIIEVETTAPQPTPSGSPGMFGANGLPHAQPPTTGHQPPIVSPYAAMNVAGVPYSAMAPSMLREQGGMSHVPTAEKWELFLAIAAPILLVSAWLVHVAPHLILWVGFIDLFVLSLVMGATGAVPSYDDLYVDVAVMLVVTFHVRAGTGVGRVSAAVPDTAGVQHGHCRTADSANRRVLGHSSGVCQ